MKKNPTRPISPGWEKIILKMKILMLLMLTGLMQVSANSYSQRHTFSIALEKGSVESVLRTIEEQSTYRFLYRSDLFHELPETTFHANGMSLDQIMDELIVSNGFVYEITENDVVVIRKAEITQPPQQERITISGVVTDTQGNPLPQATVQEEATRRGVIADIDGRFSLAVSSPDAVISFSYVGYTTQRITVGDQRVFTVRLRIDQAELSEVVVIGYGTTSRKDMTGSISSLPTHALESSTQTNIAQLMQGQLSGVFVLTGDGSPGEPAQINIRGISSLLGNSSPLIVIDDVSMPADFNLYDLDVNTVESVDVLKGASSAAIFGSRAASGVILITTKKGMKSERPLLNYTYNVSHSQLNTGVNVLTAEEWKYMMLEGAYNGAVFDGFTDPTQSVTYNNMIQPGYFGDYDTNWFALMLQNAISQNHNLSLRGGSNATNYHASFGYTDDQGVIKETGFKRYNLNLSLDSKVNDYLSWGSSFRGSLTDRDVATASLYQAAQTGRPDIAAFNDDGTIAVDIYYLTDGRPNLRQNPLSLLFDNVDNQVVKSLNVTNFINIQILPELNFRTRHTYSNSSTDQRQYFASTTTAGSGFAFAYYGRLYDINRMTQQNEFENLLNYRKSLNRHDFDVLLATSFLTEESQYDRIWLEDFPDDYTQTQAWQGATFRNVIGHYNKAAMISYISRLNYKFANRYLLTASLRRDGSSKFSKDNAYGDFPSVALAWIVNEEPFLDKIDWLNLLKIRASAGKTGMADVGFYRWRTLYETTRYAGSPAVIPIQAGNENLRWESTTQKDFGFDIAVLNSRIRGSVNYYSKDTEGLLYPFTMAPSSGYTNTTVNFAEISNTGLDIDLQGDIVRNKDLRWTIMLNYNNNSNIVKKLDKDYITSLTGAQNYSNTIVKEGYPLGLIYGFKTNGIYRSAAEVAAAEALNPDFPFQGTAAGTRAFVGEIRYVDLNGDGYVDLNTDIDNPDRTILGQSLPDFSGGFSSNLNYKNWTFNIYGTYSYGNDKVWVQELWSYQTNASAPGNIWRSSLNRWTPDNPDSDYPSFRIGRAIVTRWFNDYSVYDASYIKIQNVHLEYSFPEKILNKIKVASMLRLFASVSNVHTFTKYPGPNPESFSSSRIQGAALDNATYPQSRTYNFGVKLTVK
jgi:TonB-dependent starch-binding outer membrane protein SusC